MLDAKGHLPNMIDDIIVFGSSQEEHDERLFKVLSRLQEYNITLNEDKCKFSVSEADFLGYIVSETGLRPLQSNIQGILKLKTPENTSELATFLGTTNFYMRFVPGYADIVEPLRKLQRKDTEWEWGDEQNSAFKKLKAKLSSKPLLAHFDINCDTIVTCDSSGYAVGGVMSQIQDGVEKPIAFFSKTLSTTERKYSTSEREALACVHACEHWHFYLYGRRFLLRTDHQALKTLLSTSGTGHRPLYVCIVGQIVYINTTFLWNI